MSFRLSFRSTVVGMLAAAILLCASLTVMPVAAQGYPTKPITIVVPFTAGGPTDTVARSLAQAMSKALGGTSVLVENSGGAGGTIGAAKVKNASADGYTVLLHHIGMSTAPALYRKLQFNPTTDFESLGLIVDVPMTLVSRADFPVKDLADALNYIKLNKEKLNLANAGIGSASHLCGLLIMSALEADMTTVQYKGTADAMNSLLGKQVDLLCDQTTNTTSQIQAGTIKALAVTSKSRVSVLPQLPTLQEGGLANFEVGVWHGLYAPKGTPKDVIDKLNGALQVGLKDVDFARRMRDLGANVYPPERATPAVHAAFLKTEIDRWGPIIKKANAYAD